MGLGFRIEFRISSKVDLHSLLLLVHTSYLVKYISGESAIVTAQNYYKLGMSSFLDLLTASLDQSLRDPPILQIIGIRDLEFSTFFKRIGSRSIHKFQEIQQSTDCFISSPNNSLILFHTETVLTVLACP